MNETGRVTHASRSVAIRINEHLPEFPINVLMKDTGNPRWGTPGLLGLSMTTADAENLRTYLADAITAAPPPSKADRIREVLRGQSPGDPYYKTGYGARLDLALALLDEDGDI